MLLRGNLWATLGWLLLERQVRIPTRERGNDEFPRARELWIPAFAGMTYLFLVPMLLRGNLWAALGWLLLERQVCIPTRERGNEETEET